ncbi:contractile injection system tape measure protein, partial [Bacteroides fragilis]
MISIDSVKFDFQADNELFAQRLNARWDYSYEKIFEGVWKETMCRYDREDKVIIIEHLPLDLGILKEEEFDERFAERLRVALHEYCQKWLSEDTSY